VSAATLKKDFSRMLNIMIILFSIPRSPLKFKRKKFPIGEYHPHHLLDDKSSTVGTVDP